MQAATDALWPWLAVAGMGALHGLHPASGWAMAAAWGLHARSRPQVWWALLPIALGHAASVALVAVAVVYGLSLDRSTVQIPAAALLVAVLGLHLRRRKASARRSTMGAAGLALGSFLMSGAHGAGLMLVPALVPLCLGTSPISEAAVAGPLVLAVVAVGVHMAAMLLVTGAMAAGACAGMPRLKRLFAAELKTRPATGLAKWAPPSANILSKPEASVRRAHAPTAADTHAHLNHTSNPTHATP